MKIMLSKALVFAVIVLFIGAGVLPVFVAEAQVEDSFFLIFLHSDVLSALIV